MADPATVDALGSTIRKTSACSYDDASSSLVTRLKYGDQPQLAELMARWMRLAAGDMLESCDAILPVPLHPARLRQRGYNQAMLLAKPLARMAGKPLITRAVTRTKATPPQTGLSRSARLQNLKGAFQVKDEAAIGGKKLLLVDDVITTGATVEALAKALLAAKAEEVLAVSFARRDG